MKKNRIILTSIIIFILVFFCFYMIKKNRIGNNKSSQEVVEAILNIKSYESIIEVNIKNSKNENKYLIKQKYESENSSYQEMIEPTNIQGIKITKKQGELKIENTKLSLVSIYNNYDYLSENYLDLSSFINDYKSNNDSRYQEKQDKVIMETSNNNDIKTKKKLYIDKKTGKIEKMEIEDTNKKISVYILYKEVYVNSK